MNAQWRERVSSSETLLNGSGCDLDVANFLSETGLICQDEKKIGLSTSGIYIFARVMQSFWISQKSLIVRNTSWKPAKIVWLIPYRSEIANIEHHLVPGCVMQWFSAPEEANSSAGSEGWAHSLAAFPLEMHPTRLWRKQWLHERWSASIYSTRSLSGAVHFLFLSSHPPPHPPPR